MKAEIKRQILKALPEIGTLEAIEVMAPKNKDHGDFTSNVALKMAKKLGKNPMLLAETLAEKIKEHWEGVAVKAIPPGFINFYLGEQWIYEVFAHERQEPMGPEVRKSIETILNTEEAKGCIQEVLTPEEIKKLQYAHGRINAILRILRAEGICHKDPGISLDYHNSDVEKQILKQWMDYNRVIHQTLENGDIKILLDYLLSLSRGFYRYHEGILFRSLDSSLLYGTLKVLDSVGRIIGELLELFNIDAPERL